MLLRRTFLKGFAAAFAVAVVDPPRLIAPDNRPGAGLDFEVIEEQWGPHPREFGDFYQALMRVGDRYCQVACWIIDSNNLALRTEARAEARRMAVEYVRKGGGSRMKA
jgi:hypothetical protein